MHQLKQVLLGFRALLDEELQPLGITTAQLRLLWAVKEFPGISGAKLAELCHVTAQSGHQLMARLEEDGWISRKKNPANERVLVATLTKSGEKVLMKGRAMGEALQQKIWQGVDAAALRAFDEAMEIVGKSMERLKAGV